MFLLHSKKSNKSLEKFKYFGMAVGNQNYIPEEVKSIWDSQNVQILAYFRDLP